MAGQNSPAMSLIFVADRYESIRATVGHIRRQTARDRLEVVIVVPSAEALEGSDLEAFRHVRIVELGGPLTSLSRARAAGIRRASAPVVALTETHSFPDPGWAEALIKAHQGPWAGVAPVVASANPRGSLSRAVFLVGFGAWAAPLEAGPVEGLPGNNGSYKRDLLLGYGDRLDTMLMPEMTLQQELRSNGHRFYLEPAATTRHLNVNLLRSWVRHRWHTGRLIAAARAEDWAVSRRLLYAAGAPLIPLVRLRRTLPIARRVEHGDFFPGVLPALVLALVVASAGELIGYVFGAGRSEKKMIDVYIHRIDHVKRRDRRSGDPLAG
jgi:hypothetical protein